MSNTNNTTDLATLSNEYQKAKHEALAALRSARAAFDGALASDPTILRRAVEVVFGSHAVKRVEESRTQVASGLTLYVELNTALTNETTPSIEQLSAAGFAHMLCNEPERDGSQTLTLCTEWFTFTTA